MSKLAQGVIEFVGDVGGQRSGTMGRRQQVSFPRAQPDRRLNQLGEAERSPTSARLATASTGTSDPASPYTCRAARKIGSTLRAALARNCAAVGLTGNC
jgi:hypothetical protein